jgi:putative addiction module component (TIGR02574 family)
MGTSGSVESSVEIAATEISQEWRDELSRRVESIGNGTFPGIRHEEVMTNVRTQLANTRKENQAA